MERFFSSTSETSSRATMRLALYLTLLATVVITTSVAAEVNFDARDPIRDADVVSPAIYFPAFTEGGYSRPGPLAEQLLAATFYTRRGSDYGFSAAMVVYPAEAGVNSSIVYPALAWGAGAHHGCDFIDNKRSMEHLASWGFIVFCPVVSVIPFIGGSASAHVVSQSLML
jgi:hypothetical protein